MVIWLMEEIRLTARDLRNLVDTRIFNNLMVPAAAGFLRSYRLCELVQLVVVYLQHGKSCFNVNISLE